MKDNKYANRAIKEAIEWYIIDKKEYNLSKTANRYLDTKLFKILISITINTKMKARWEEEWRNERIGRNIYKFILIFTPKLLNLYKNVFKVVSLVII